MNVMEADDIIGLYETVAEITNKMLAAARQGDWDRLAELESSCASQVDLIRNEEPRTPLKGAVRERKVALVKQVLEDDRQIRLITEPWFEQLAEIINTADRKPAAAGAHGTG